MTVRDAASDSPGAICAASIGRLTLVVKPLIGERFARQWGRKVLLMIIEGEWLHNEEHHTKNGFDYNVSILRISHSISCFPCLFLVFICLSPVDNRIGATILEHRRFPLNRTPHAPKLTGAPLLLSTLWNFPISNIIFIHRRLQARTAFPLSFIHTRNSISSVILNKNSLNSSPKNSVFQTQ